MKKFATFLCLLPALLFGQYQYDLTVCAIFQNESRFLPEWIEFHEKQGVQHFYLYNHCSTDEFRTVLYPYILCGLVEIIDWDFPYTESCQWNPIQCNAYMHCVKRIKKTVRWCAFIDTDEFLFSPNVKLLDTLKDYSKYDAVVANWIVYGTSHIWHAENLTTELLMRSSINHPSNRHVKSIVRPSKVLACVNPHVFITKNRYSVTENHEKITTPFNENISVKKLRINHYAFRDREFLETVKIPRYEKWQIEDDLIWYDDNLNNVEYDDCILNNL